MPAAPTLAPSDLPQREITEPVRVAGRVLATGAQSFDLADAFAAVRVRTAAPEPVSAGDLVTVIGTWTGEALVAARIETQARCEPPSGRGEFARFALSPVGRNLRARSQALEVVRAYFREQSFVEVETPVRVPAPGVDLHMDAVPAEGGFLITSPEYQMKRLLAGGLPRIFQIGRATRRGELGPLHEPEFTMLEWYRAFADQTAVMRDTEEIVARVIEALAGEPSVTRAGTRVEVRPPFPRLTVRDAFRLWAGVDDAVDLAASDEDRYFQLWVDRVEPALARSAEPVFVCAYPATQAALARRSPEDPSVAERFELYLAGVELCNGYGELTDPVEQRARIEADTERRTRTGRAVYPLDERFLAALAEGMPPSAGNALGFDRLVMLALGATTLEEIVAFPSRLL